MSGRWRASVDGRLTGSSCGSSSVWMSNPGSDRPRREAFPPGPPTVAGLVKSVFQGRQGGPGLGELRLLGEHIGTRNSTQLKLALDQFICLFLFRQNFPCRLELGPQGCFLDGGRDDIGGQCQVGPLQ